MSSKSILGIDLTEWNTLSGLSDPYSLELAKISAEAGVPRSHMMNEAMAKPNTPAEKRLAAIKQSHRKLRQQGKGVQGSGSFSQLGKLTRQKSEDGEQLVFPYEAYLEAFLDDNGSSLYEFNMLLDYAIESGDEDLQDELLDLEEMLDDELEEALGAAVLGGLKAAGKAGLAVGKKGAQLAGKGIVKGAQLAGKGIQKGAQLTGKAAGSLAKSAKAGYQSGMGASQAASQAAAAPEPAQAAPAAPPVAPAQAPAAGAVAPGASAAAPMGATPAQAAPAAAPSQPGQTSAPEKKKKPGALSLIGRGIGKVAKGVAGGLSATAGGLARGAGRLGSGIKQGYTGEDVEYWEEFLGENGLSIEQYMSVVEDAYEYGDEEMIESSHQLDEIFAAWKEKKLAAQREKQAKVKAGWEKARDVISKHGAETVRAASLRGIDVPKKKAANEAIDKQLQLMGYSDEYIEARSEKSAERKSKQYHGLYKASSDDFISKRASKKAGKDLVKLVDNPDNELAPQLVKTLRRIRK